MKKWISRIVMFGAFGALLSSCGDTCSSDTAKVASVGNCGTVQTGQEISLDISVCMACEDSQPTCDAEVRGNEIELSATVRKCQEQSDCAATACQRQTVACNFVAPAPGTYELVWEDAGGIKRKPVVVGASGETSCTI